MLRQLSSRGSNLRKANRFISCLVKAVSSWPSRAARVPFVSVNALTILGKSQSGFHISKKSNTGKFDSAGKFQSSHP